MLRTTGMTPSDDLTKNRRHEQRHLLWMSALMIVWVFVIFLLWPHKVAASWFSFATLVLALIPFPYSVMDLSRLRVGELDVGDKSARTSLYRPLTLGGVIAVTLIIGSHFHGESPAEKASFTIVTDLLLVVGVVFAYWSHEWRRLGLLTNPPENHGVSDEDVKTPQK